MYLLTQQVVLANTYLPTLQSSLKEGQIFKKNNMDMGNEMSFPRAKTAGVWS